MSHRNIDCGKVTYLSNACGEGTGHGDASEEDFEKIPFEEGPGVVLTYLVEIKGKKYALGNLEVSFNHEWWGEDGADLMDREYVLAYCQTACEDIKTRLKDDMRLLELDVRMPGRLVIGVAIPLESLADVQATLEAFKRVYGKYADLPNLKETTVQGA